MSIPTMHQIGTFDLENYGDLLYPILWRRLVERKAKGEGVRHYSLLGGHAPQQAGFESYPLQDLFHAAESVPIPNLIMVGGGDLLRTDSHIVAAHYHTTHARRFGSLRRSIGIGNSFNYLLRKHLPRVDHAKFYTECFGRRRMKDCSLGPFLLDPHAFKSGTLISYLSCGVPHDFALAKRREVAQVLDRASFIYVRDEISANRLRGAGVRKEINVAPDLAVILSEQFDYASESRKGRQILSKFGVKEQQPVLCFQSNPYPGFREDEICKQLNQYRQKNGFEVALLPLGFCHHDDIFLKGLAAQSRGALKYIDVSSVFDMISVIAASDVFVGTSLHGNITAFSFGIPHLFGPLPVSKIDGFLSLVESPQELKLRSWTELNSKLEMVTGMDRAIFSKYSDTARARVHRVVDDLFEILR